MKIKVRYIPSIETYFVYKGKLVKRWNINTAS